MPTRPAHQVLRDFTSVCQHTSPVTAARWAAALLAHLPECMRNRSLRPADRSWEMAGAKFRTSTGATVTLPGAYTAGAREMYCRNVYLRTGLVMPSAGWVIDLGANRGLFSVWAALSGARSIAVEAQHGFAQEIRRLALHNAVDERVHIEIAVASGVKASGSEIGQLADDRVWARTSHGGFTYPTDRSVPELIAKYSIDRVGLMKMDIEGGEFAVLANDEDLSWLRQVDQLAIELHGGHGDVTGLIDRLRNEGLVVDLRDDFGDPAAPTSSAVAYAYCRRPQTS
jgi:FkbM family methyltransferase